MNGFQKDDIIRALWCVNSENGEEVLINLDTNEILLRRVGGQILPPFEDKPKEG